MALSGGTAKPLSEFAGCTVHAVAAIGNPRRFFDMLRAEDIDVIEHALPDHAVLGPDDINFGDGHPVLMTEKDAVKCARIARAQHWYVPVDAAFEARDAQSLVGIVVDAIGRRAVRAAMHG